MKEIILFDIDLNLLDTRDLKDRHNQVLRQELGISTEEFQKAVDGYYEEYLELSTDFDPNSFTTYLAEKFGKSPKSLLPVYERDDIYKKALYPETLEALKTFSKEVKVGVYSEGQKEYQMKKLEKSGIIDFLDKGMIYIFRRKKEFENIKKLPPSVVVDDRVDVIEMLMSFPNLTPVLVDRNNDKKEVGVTKISNLLELLDLLKLRI